MPGPAEVVRELLERHKRAWSPVKRSSYDDALDALALLEQERDEMDRSGGRLVAKVLALHKQVKHLEAGRDRLREEVHYQAGRADRNYRHGKALREQIERHEMVVEAARAVEACEWSGQLGDPSKLPDFIEAMKSLAAALTPPKNQETPGPTDPQRQEDIEETKRSLPRPIAERN